MKSDYCTSTGFLKYHEMQCEWEAVTIDKKYCCKESSTHTCWPRSDRFVKSCMKRSSSSLSIADATMNLERSVFNEMSFKINE